MTMNDAQMILFICSLPLFLLGGFLKIEEKTHYAHIAVFVAAIFLILPAALHLLTLAYLG